MDINLEKLGTLPESERDLITETMKVVETNPGQPAMNVWYELARRLGQSHLEKKNWSQREFYRVMRMARRQEIIPWRAMPSIPD